MKARFCLQCGHSLEDDRIDGKPVQRCPSSSCGFIHWDNPVPVVAGIIERDDAVLLARNAAWPEKVFGLITGFLENAEEPDKAIVREIREELGCEGRVIGLVGAYGFAEKNQVLIVYHMGIEGDISLGEELAETKWVPAEKLKPWPFGTGHAVKDWLERRAR